MAFRTFDQTTTAAHSEQVHRVRFRVGSGAGSFLLQRLASFKLQLRQQPSTGYSAVTAAFSRTPPCHPMAMAAAVAALIVAGMILCDHATISVSVSTAGVHPAKEAHPQIDNADNDTKDTRRLYIGTSIPRPNPLWAPPALRRRHKTQVPTETPTRTFTAKSANTLSKLTDRMSPHTHALVQGRAYEGNVLELTVNRYSATWVLITSMLYIMQAAARGGDRRGMGNVPDPPPYDPAHERTQPFQQWTQQLMIWSIFLATELDQRQQATAIISQLRGEAALMVQNMSDSGILVDPVNYVIHNIAQAFAPTGDGGLWGDRMQAIRELKSFHHERNESIDAILDRFSMTR